MAERFHVSDTLLESGALVEFGDEESHHLLRVMRAKPGQPLQVFGGGRVFEGTLHSVEGKRARALLGQEISPPAPPAFHTTYVLPWLKGGRSETVIQKLTELGAASIIIYSARREVARIEPGKVDRLIRTAIEACKQCERADPPSVALATGLREALAQSPLPVLRRLVLAERDASGLRLSQALSGLLPPDNTARSAEDDGPTAFRLGALLIASGPEGGFAPEELAAADELAVRVSLGPRILRAETAPLAAAAAILAAGGDL